MEKGLLIELFVLVYEEATLQNGRKEVGVKEGKTSTEKSGQGLCMTPRISKEFITLFVNS